MAPESTQNFDLIKSRLELGSGAPAEKAARLLAADKTQGKHSQGKEADRKRWKAALDFEGMFLSQMYKGMRKTTAFGEDDELTKASPGREIFTEMLDNTYATMSAKNPLMAGDQGMENAAAGISNSLAAQIYRSLSRQAGGTEAHATAPDAATAPVKGSPSAQDATAVAVPRLSDDKLKSMVEQAAGAYGVSANLIQSVIKAESNNHPLAVSGAGAKGLMQLIDSTARDMGVRDVFNPHENILGGTRYLKQMLDRFGGDETKALAAYNAGPAMVERYGGVPPFRETRDYVEKILKARKNLDAADSADIPNLAQGDAGGDR